MLQGMSVGAHVDCAWHIPGRREFDARYVTPHEDQVLIAFELPKR
jgi:hypothetical protein